MSQLVEAVDEHGHAVAVVERADARRNRIRYRVTLVALTDGHGRILVSRRALTKATMPGLWDVASGGAIDPGESPLDAAIRELEEELGVTGVELCEIGSALWDDEASSTFIHCFLGEYRGPVTFTDGEVIAAEYLDSASVLGLAAASQLCPDSYAIVYPKIAHLLR